VTGNAGGRCALIPAAAFRGDSLSTAGSAGGGALIVAQSGAA